MKNGAVAMLLVVVSAAVAQHGADPLKAVEIPPGWVLAPSEKQNPELWQCAKYGGGWVVGKDASGTVTISDENSFRFTQPRLPASLKLGAGMVGRRSVQQTAYGWLIGFDAGEFGGGLWWFSRNGSDTQKLLPDNVKAIYNTPKGILVLTGLAHLSHDDGSVYKFIDATDKVTVRWLSRLGRSPEASTLDRTGAVIAATTQSVLRISPDGSITRLYESEVPLVYPTSTQVDSSGIITVAMRFFILRLIPSDTGGYREEWLMPRKCAAITLKKYTCTCTGK